MSEPNIRQENAGASPSSASDYKAFFTSVLTETYLFSEVGRIIASELQPGELIQKIVTAIGKSVIFEDASVYAVKTDLTGLVPLYFINPLLQSKMSEPIYLDNGAPGRIVASGEPLFLEDSSRYETFLHHPDEARKQGSYIGIPLKSDNRVVGVMGFSHSKPSAFSVEVFDLLRTLATTISAGLEKAALFKKTLEIARTDELTGMLNYRVLLEKLDKEFGRQVRTGRDLSFIMIDIDNFKRVNDRYGHMEGSRVLAQMGALLRDQIRSGSTDTCFRYGGEEFSILLAETGIDETLAIAERMRKTVEQYPFTLKTTHPLDAVIITVSLGVTTRKKGDTKNIAELIQEADIALYRSKAEGKNRVTGYGPGMTMPGAAQDENNHR